MKKFTKDIFEKPMGFCIVGGYDLHLYCANKNNEIHNYNSGLKGFGEFGGNNKFEAFRFARQAGWVISEKKDLAICPDCVKAKNY